MKFKVETGDGEQESVKLDSKSLPKSLNNTHQINQPFRTQTFSQNHPTFVQTELPKDIAAGNIQNQTMVPYDKSPNLLYQKPDFSVMNTQKNLPFPMPNQPQMFEAQQNVNQARSYQQNLPNTIGMHPRPTIPYQNMQYPPYNAWKQEERPPQTTSTAWWPNLNQSFPQQDNYQMNMQYSGNMQQYIPTGTSFPNNDFGSKPPSVQNADMYSLWNSHRGGSSQGNVGYDLPNQGLSMRQVMLKETTNMPGMGGFGQGANRGNGVSDSSVLSNIRERN